MARNTDEVFPESPGGELVERAESDSAPVVSESVEPADQAVKAEPAKAVAAPQVADDDGDEQEDEIPKDLAGLEKALKAARGDGRRHRKQWKGVESERQKLERRVAMMEGELNALRRQPAAPEKPTTAEAQAPGFWEHDDPDKYIAEKVTGAIGSFEAKQREREIKRDEQAMRRAHEDFDDSVAAFQSAAGSNPQLVEAFRRSDDPVGFAYERGKELARLQKYEATSLSDLEAKIEAKLRAELGQPSQVTPKPPAAKPPVPPRSNAGARGSGVGATNAWQGPRPTEEVWRE